MKTSAQPQAATHATPQPGDALAQADQRPVATMQRQMQADIAASPHQVLQCQAQADIAASPRQAAQPSLPFNRTGLPNHLKAGVEALSGHSLDDVQVHYNSARPAQLQAHAYAQGSDIHLAPGQEKHLPHEAWHVVQQKQGRVRATTQLKGVEVNDNGGLEKEADQMGLRALTGVAPEQNRQARPASLPQPVIQARWIWQAPGEQAAPDQHILAIEEALRSNDLFGAFQLAVRASPFSLEEEAHSLLVAIEDNEVAEQRALWLLGQAHMAPEEYTVDQLLFGLYHDAGIRQALAQPEATGHLPANGSTMASETTPLPSNSPTRDLDEETDEMAMDEDQEMNDLTRQFANLTISFRSDVDGGREEHSLYPNKDATEVVVESNPVLLQHIIDNRQWEAHKLTPAQVTQLKQLRRAAKHALYTISGHAKKKNASGRSVKNMELLRKELANIATALGKLGVSALTTPPLTVLNATNHGVNSGNVEGSQVIASPLSIHSNTRGSKPQDGRLMKAIRNLAGEESKSYKQMHLLNDLVFGPGELWNLTPGPAKSNSEMESKVEHYLKEAVLGKGLIIHFEAKVNYTHNPMGASNKEIQQNPNKYRFQSIKFTAYQLDAADPTKKAATQDSSVSKINDTVNWQYGSLTPLVAKPRIQEKATSADDLRDAADVEATTAQRIVAYVNSSSFKKIATGTGKKEQLLNAVYEYDKATYPTYPNGNWKATNVLWT